MSILTLQTGPIWSETQTDKTGQLAYAEFLDALQPQPERKCVPVPGFSICAVDQTRGDPVILPPRAGAIVMEAEQYSLTKTALDEACRLLGSRCTLEIQKALTRSNTLVNLAPRQ